MNGNGNSAEQEAHATVSLEILTGPARGTAYWLSGTTLDISVNESDMIRVSEADGNHYRMA